MKLFVLAACSVFVIVGTEGTAQQRQSCTGPQLGTWKLQSYALEDQGTHQTTHPFGTTPSGYASFGPDCRMYAILVAEGRKPPASGAATDAEGIELYRGLISYTGAYSVEKDKISVKVDASWNQAWTGTTQDRQFRIEGTTLRFTNVSTANALTGKPASSVLIWTKVE